MNSPTLEILHKLDDYRDRIFCRPLSDEEIEQMQSDVGVPMPRCLREYLQTIGLFHDLHALLIQVFGHPSEFFSAREIMLDMLGNKAGQFFPLGHDGAGNIFVLDQSSDTDAVIWFVDHEMRTVEKTNQTFNQWLTEVVGDVLKNIDQYPLNSLKVWSVQFSFKSEDIEPILAVLAQFGLVRLLENKWHYRATSPSNVRSLVLEFEFNGETYEARKLEYSRWPSPMISFDMDESVEVPLSESLIRRLDEAFKAAFSDYVIIDYGRPFEKSRI